MEHTVVVPDRAGPAPLPMVPQQAVLDFAAAIGISTHDVRSITITPSQVLVERYLLRTDGDAVLSGEEPVTYREDFHIEPAVVVT